MLSFNQTYEEHDAGRARLWLDKNRDAPSAKAFAIKTDWARSRMEEL